MSATLRERLLARFRGNDAEFEQVMTWVAEDIASAEARGFERARERAATSIESTTAPGDPLVTALVARIRAMKDETP